MKANLLVVDENDDTRAALVKVLTHRGYNVTCARSGGEAVKLATNSPFDLVVMGHGLPDGNGCQYMKVLHDTYKLEGIALTASAYASDRQMSRDAGFCAHLNKPVDTAMLCTAIEAGLEKQRHAVAEV